MTNIQLAQKLHEMAAHLQNQPEVEIGTFNISSMTRSGEEFKNIAKVFPRPLKKEIKEWGGTIRPDLILTGGDRNLTLYFSICREKVCRIVEPAKPAVFECEPLLSPDEESELERA